MIPDRFGALHENCDPQALAAYESAAAEFLRHRSPVPSLFHALALDPRHGGALALKGFCNILLARQETVAQARAIYSDMPEKSGSSRDLVLREALGLCCEGRTERAIAILREYLADRPSDIVAIKIVHALQFMSGAGRDMAAFMQERLGRLDAHAPGYAYVLGCHAFALEEAGDFAQAEALAQAALHGDRCDLWAMHALAHVYEMNGRNREGVIWIESARDLWADAGNFGFHLAWHLALFNLNLGKSDRALAIYDYDVRAVRTEDFRDMANAVSILWRLRQEGVDTGERFEELAEIARRRSADTTLIFASLHNLLALIATGDLDGAEALLSSLRAEALCADRTQAAVVKTIGLPLAAALVDFARADSNASLRRGLSDLPLRDLPLLGGSHAQRDVFLRSLAMMAAQSGDRNFLDSVLGVRHEMRSADRFLAMVETLARERRAARTLGHAA